MAAATVSLLGYMLVCSFTPGPGNILALNTASRCGWRRSRPLLLGICLGYGVVQAICSVFLVQLGQISAASLWFLKIAGGIYMIWLAVHMIRSKPGNQDMEQSPTFWNGLLLQLVNVKIYFYITTLLTAYFIPNCDNGLELAAAGVFAVSVGSAACLTWAFLGSRLQGVYTRFFNQINMVLGLFLIYCAWTILKG